MQSNIRNLWFGTSFVVAVVLGFFSGGFKQSLVGLVTIGGLDKTTAAALMSNSAVGVTCGVVVIGLAVFLLGYVGLAVYDAITTITSRNRLTVLREALYGDETPSRDAFIECFVSSPELAHSARRHAEKLYVFASRKKQSGTAFTVFRASQSAAQSFRLSLLVDHRLAIWLFRAFPPAFIGTGVFSFAATLSTGTPTAIASVALAVSAFGAMIVIVGERAITGFRHSQVAALSDDIDATYRPSGESVSLEEIIRASHESAELVANATLATQEDFRSTMENAVKGIAAKLEENSNTIVNTLTETAQAQGPNISEAVTKALSEPIEKLTAATESVASEQSEQVRDLINTVLEGFIDELKSVVGDEFKQLDQLIKASSESAGKLEQIYTEAFMQMADQSSTLSTELADQFKSIIEAIKSEEAERAEAQRDSISSLTGEFKSIIEAFRAEEEDLVKARSESLGSVAGEFKSVIDSLKSEDAERVKAQTDAIGAVTTEFKSIIDTLKAEEADRVKAQTESVGALTGEFKSVIDTLKSEEAERVKAQIDSVSGLANEFKSIVDTLKAEEAERVKAQTESVGALAGEIKSVIDTLKAEEVERVKVQTESMKSMTDDLSQTIKGITDGLGASVKDIAGVMSSETKEIATSLTAETKEIATTMAADANRHAEEFNAALDRAAKSLESIATEQIRQTTEDLAHTASTFESLHNSLENVVTLVTPMIRQVIDNQENLLQAIESESSNSRVLSRAASEMSAAAQVSRTTVDRFLALAEVLRETSSNMGRAANSNAREQVTATAKPKKAAAAKTGNSSLGDAIRQLRNMSQEESEEGTEED